MTHSCHNTESFTLQVANRHLRMGCKMPGVQPPGSQDQGELRWEGCCRAASNVWRCQWGGHSPQACRAPARLQGDPCPQNTHTHSVGSSYLGYLRTRCLMALVLNEQMLQWQIYWLCVMPSSVLNILRARPRSVLPTTIVVSILLMRKMKLREVKKHAQGHAGDRGQSTDYLRHSGPRA